MDIGRGMVTALVDELLHEEAIYEGATVDAPRGRKPKMLYVRTRDRLVVGVDVRFSRTYLMLEALSLPFVGPNLHLSPDNKPGDGPLFSRAERRT